MRSIVRAEARGRVPPLFCIRFIVIVLTGLMILPLYAGSPLPKMRPVDTRTRDILNIYYSAWLRYNAFKPRPVFISPYPERTDSGMWLDRAEWFTVMACHAATASTVLSYFYGFTGLRNELIIPVGISSTCSAAATSHEYFVVPHAMPR